MEELSATGHVRGTDPDPYAVKLQVTPTGFTSECSCPAFPKINGHCKHVAALLIALRDQVRPKQPRPDPPQNGTTPMPHATPSGNDLDMLSGGSRRARRRARKLAAQRAAAAAAGSAALHGRPGFTIEGTGMRTGVDAWIAEPMPPAPKSVEYRMQVRSGALTVSILD